MVTAVVLLGVLWANRGGESAGVDLDPPIAARDEVPRLTDPEATARAILEDWLAALNGKGSIEPFLATNYQIQRSDGSGGDRQQYLDAPAAIHEYDLGDDITALQANNTLTVTWNMRVTETIGRRFIDDVTADRLTVFEWIDDAWRIVGYGNFNPIESPRENDPDRDQVSDRPVASSRPPSESGPDDDRDEVWVPLVPVKTLPPILDGSPVSWSPLRPPAEVVPSVPTTTAPPSTTTPPVPTTTVPDNDRCTHPGNSGNTPAVTAPGRPCDLPVTPGNTAPPRNGDDSDGRHDRQKNRR